MKFALITKFAMRFAEDNPRRRYERPGWIDYRLGLFERYCAPSVEAQTFHDFEWWILVARGFPGLNDSHIRRLSEYGYVLDIDTAWSEQQPEIGELLNIYEDEWVTTTRLDSDDMLHKDFYKTLNETVEERESWTSFEYGYIMEGDYAAKRRYVVNPFVSYTEFAAPLKTVYHVSHTKADRTSAPMTVIPKVGWAQIDHGDNIKNHARDKVRDFHKVKVLRSELEGFPCT